jgi:hypothetical protein
MAIVNVKAKVTAPEEINIVLVREDHSGTSNAFRVFFEISLSLFSGLFGVTLSIPQPQVIHWVSLIILGLFGISFLVMSFRYKKKAAV